MKAIAMKFRETKFRAFYRICILPLHIPTRTGETKKAMETELASHEKYVTEQGLKTELQVYKTARNLRQSTYDALILAQTLVKQEPSEKNGLNVEKAEVAFTKAKLAYQGAYQ